MSRELLWIWLILTAALSVAAMVVGVRLQNQTLATLAAIMFSGVAVIVGWRFAGLAASDGSAANTSAQFARLIATAWAWAGTAMIASYYMTELRWQHAWQYGIGMLLIAGLALSYARNRLEPGSRLADPGLITAARWVTRLQGIVALIAVVVLALSDKLQPDKQDWAANIVFVTGGLALFALSMAALRAEQRALDHG